MAAAIGLDSAAHDTYPVAEDSLMETAVQGSQLVVDGL
jgi:hypothetical protein